METGHVLLNITVLVYPWQCARYCSVHVEETATTGWRGENLKLVHFQKEVTPS